MIAQTSETSASNGIIKHPMYPTDSGGSGTRRTTAHNQKYPTPSKQTAEQMIATSASEDRWERLGVR